MSVRFLHTSDWQLGMTRAFLPRESQARYADDQIEAIRRLASIAAEHECSFVVVAGDVFDSIQPDRRVVSRAVDALGTFTMPVYLVPGNHDADSPAALWSTSDVVNRLPAGVHIVRGTGPVAVPGVAAEVVGAPWPSRRPDCAEMLSSLVPPEAGTVRVAIGHGAVDSIAPDPSNPALISLAALESAISDGRVSYVALGDRHSVTSIGGSGAIWYSGAPVATAFREIEPNKALVVEIDGTSVSVERVDVGGWRFIADVIEASGPAIVPATEAFLAELTNRDRTVVRLGFVGTIGLSTNADLEETLDRSADLFAALDRSQRRSDLLVVADDADLGQLDLSGFAQEAMAEVAALAAGESDQSQVASDALVLLYRLAARRS